MKMLKVKGYPGFDFILSHGTGASWETWGEHIASNVKPGGKDLIRASRPPFHHQFILCNTLFHEYAAGLRPDPANPGFGHFYLRPYLFNHIDNITYSYPSFFGKIESSWQRKDKQFTSGAGNLYYEVKEGGSALCR